MNQLFMDRFFANETEKPLDTIVEDGGYCRIFRTIGCIGDSLSSGEFESLNEAGERHYHDYFAYSWGQFMARNAGCQVYNFSRGGMTAKEYWDSFAESQGFWAEDKLCQAYIIALGINDLKDPETGSVQDIDLQDYQKNRDTFAGYYGRIIQRLKSMQPGARFFLMTFAREPDRPAALPHRQLMYDLAALFDHTYVLDLYQYGPEYDAQFKKKFYLSGHMNAAGYILTAQLVTSYIDYIVRHNLEDFSQIGFVGTPYRNVSAPW